MSNSHNKLFVSLAEVRLVDVDVDHCGLDTFVTEHPLDMQNARAIVRASFAWYVHESL